MYAFSFRNFSLFSVFVSPSSHSVVLQLSLFVICSVFLSIRDLFFCFTFTSIVACSLNLPSRHASFGFWLDRHYHYSYSIRCGSLCGFYLERNLSSFFFHFLPICSILYVVHSCIYCTVIHPAMRTKQEENG